jgi:hypothetical protein
MPINAILDDKKSSSRLLAVLDDDASSSASGVGIRRRVVVEYKVRPLGEEKEDQCTS